VHQKIKLYEEAKEYFFFKQSQLYATSNMQMDYDENMMMPHDSLYG
jgi:hypothetical protein